MALSNNMGREQQTSDDTRSQLGNFDGNITILEAGTDELSIGNYRIKQETQSISSTTLIWNNEAFGIWGSFYWGNAAEAGFILGHSLAGKLGINKLGSQASEYELSGVFNDNNTFPEGFWNDRFIGSESTGSWYEVDECYEIDSGEELITTTIAKENKVYKSVVINLTTEYASGASVGSDANADITAYASNTNGTTWEEVSLTTTSTLSDGNNSGLKVKFKNSGLDTGLLTMPLTMPLDFTAGKLNIKEFNVKYEA